MLHFELITPEKIAISRKADMVVVPGKEGDFGAMEGHMPLISTIRPGVLEVYEGDKIVETIFINSGFAEANASKLTVLAHDAIPVKESDIPEINAKLEAAEKELMALEERTPSHPKREVPIHIGGHSVLIRENHND